jgi:uncharacterized protein (TIGR02588 family)
VNDAERLERRLGWAGGALGALVVGATLGFLGWSALTDAGRPPDLALELGSPVANGAAWHAPFVAVNRGDRTAAAVKVLGELKLDGRVVETSEADLDYVPARSRREGGLFFSRDPADFELTLRATGYAAP